MHGQINTTSLIETKLENSLLSLFSGHGLPLIFTTYYEASKNHTFVSGFAMSNIYINLNLSKSVIEYYSVISEEIGTSLNGTMTYIQIILFDVIPPKILVLL